jgi:hypothetical protein
MHRSLIPGTGSSPTRTPSAESTFGVRLRGAVFFTAVFRVVFFAMVDPLDQAQSECSRQTLVSGSGGNRD